MRIEGWPQLENTDTLDGIPEENASLEDVPRRSINSDGSDEDEDTIDDLMLMNLQCC